MKVIKMKKISKILAIMLMVIFLYSCGEDTIIDGLIPGQFTLSGTIENWTKGGNIKLRADLYDSNGYNFLVLDSNIVSVSGAFTLKLKNAPDSLQYSITFNPDTSCINTVTVNPAGTKSSSSVAFGLFNDSFQTGYLYKSNYSADSAIVPGQFFVYYLSLNQNVSITGSIICNFEPYHDTIIYNFSGGRGWNKIVILYDTYTEFTLKATVSATEPSGGKWFIGRIFTSDSLSSRLSAKQRTFRFLNRCMLCK